MNSLDIVDGQDYSIEVPPIEPGDIAFENQTMHGFPIVAGTGFSKPDLIPTLVFQEDTVTEWYRRFQRRKLQQIQACLDADPDLTPGWQVIGFIDGKQRTTRAQFQHPILPADHFSVGTDGQFQSADQVFQSVRYQLGLNDLVVREVLAQEVSPSRFAPDGVMVTDADNRRVATITRDYHDGTQLSFNAIGETEADAVENLKSHPAYVHLVEPNAA